MRRLGVPLLISVLALLLPVWYHNEHSKSSQSPAMLASGHARWTLPLSQDQMRP